MFEVKVAFVQTSAGPADASANRRDRCVTGLSILRHLCRELLLYYLRTSTTCSMNRRLNLNAQGTNVPETKRAEPEAGTAKLQQSSWKFRGPAFLQAGPSPSLVVSKQPQMTLEKAQLRHCHEILSCGFEVFLRPCFLT